MSLLHTSPENDRFFNNADSFAMAFDDNWKNCSSEIDGSSKSKEKKIDIVFAKIKEHPFLKEYPKEAKEIAMFRLRLLKLN